ncbi:phage repressor protein C with HTH and peptisase S24 domain [Orbus hercynius]|uniref:Phage repressor protein C with HTH and peptisase S24 domain n=1 Tax=Orbus hercynius TaxID=593135 RepID=A0A495RI89_9GAMM|nr:S24 family peptidase [Orbus hercynius]RKS87232.1 phage repressor protein C with HTH and peptisase S24 domain [Orbus hercynius]
MTELEKQKLLADTGILEFKNRLSLAQEGMSGNAFAKKVGMSEAVIRDYLSGKTYPSLNRLAMIAKKCNVPIEWLATGQGECRLISNKSTQKVVYIPAYQNKPSDNYDPLAPLDNKRTLPFDLNCIKHHNFDIEQLYVFTAKGDSMSPTISDNDTLIINTANLFSFDGYIYVIEYGESFSVKRIQNHGKYFLLLSDNEKYPSIKIDKSNSADEFKIIGRVICILKDLS